MKKMMRKTIAVVVALTVVFSAAITTCNAVYTDEVPKDSIQPLWENETLNGNRD